MKIKCLKCNKEFKTENKTYNRICPKCNRENLKEARIYRDPLPSHRYKPAITEDV